MPAELSVVTVTEVASFRECRRAWYLANIRHLQPKTPQWQFWFGRAIHSALEYYFRVTNASEQGVIDEWDVLCAKAEIEFEVEYGPLWQHMRPEFMELFSLGDSMLRGYVAMDKDSPFDWKPIHIEERWRVPILNSTGRSMLKGTPVLSAQMDLVALTANRKGVAVVDHKTSAQNRMSGEALDLDDQLTGYGYVYYRKKSQIPDELVYDTLVKAAPEPPHMTTRGLSKDKRQKTTFALYKQAIKDNNLKESDYLDILEHFSKRGTQDYFHRETTSRNLSQLLSYENRLFYTYQQMRDTARDPRLAYAEPHPMRCPRCPYLSVCLAMEDGSDAESLIEARFKEEIREK